MVIMSVPGSHSPSSHIASYNKTHHAGGPPFPDPNAFCPSDNLNPSTLLGGPELQTASRQDLNAPSPQLGPLDVRRDFTEHAPSELLDEVDYTSWLSDFGYKSNDSIEQPEDSNYLQVDQTPLEDWPVEVVECATQPEEGESSSPRNKVPHVFYYKTYSITLTPSQQRHKVAHDPSRPSLDMTESAALTDGQQLKALVPGLVTLGEYDKSKRCLRCPFRVVQEKLNLRYSCRARPVTTMSEIRRHLIRDKVNGREPHLPFLHLCKACNEDFLHMAEFESFHGYDGLLCKHPKKQRKGDAGQQEQYDILCAKVETYMTMDNTLQGQSTLIHPLKGMLTHHAADVTRISNSETHSSMLSEIQPTIAQKRPAIQTTDHQSSHIHKSRKTVSVRARSADIVL
jgi:hypothetical protein